MTSDRSLTPFRIWIAVEMILSKTMLINIKNTFRNALVFRVFPLIAWNNGQIKNGAINKQNIGMDILSSRTPEFTGSGCALRRHDGCRKTQAQKHHSGF